MSDLLHDILASHAAAQLKSVELGTCPIVVTDAESAKRAGEWVESQALEAFLRLERKRIWREKMEREL